MRDTGGWGVTYWSSWAGPHMWDRFDTDGLGADLAAMARNRVGLMRLPLPWGTFVPRPGARNGRALAELELVLDSAAAAGLGVVVVFGPQSMGDTLSLPAFAVDHGRRGRTRVLVDGRQEPGSPRDLYADEGMLEAQVEWLELLLAAFGGHPAIAGWDLGHDPASTIRPRRVAHMTAWVRLLAGTLREAGELSWLTLGPGDFIRARGVRPNLLASAVDTLGLALMPQRLRIGSAFPDQADVLFLLEIARQLVGETPLAMALAVGAGPAPAPPVSVHDPGVASEEEAGGYLERLLPQLLEAGPAYLLNHPSHNPADGVTAVPPLDRCPGLGEAGWFDRTNELTALGRIWTRHAAHPILRQRVNQGLTFDVEAYFVGLPDSLMDLRAEWRGGPSGHPDILV